MDSTIYNSLTYCYPVVIVYVQWYSNDFLHQMWLHPGEYIPLIKSVTNPQPVLSEENWVERRI